MARRIIIGEIVNLIKGLGGNPSKFMGTKSNINFLGKGPKEALFQGQIDIDALMRSEFPLNRVISEAETAGGYATANKLNDIQLQRLKENLITLKKAYMPEPVANITDLGTGTKDLTQEGLGSLRTTQMLEESRPILDQAAKLAAAESAAMRKAGLDPSKQADFFKWEEIKKGKGITSFSEELSGAEEVPTAGLMARLAERMKRIQKMSDELGAIGKGDVDKAGTYQFIDPTAEKASYASRFNPKNEIHVQKAEALLKDPQIKGVYTEAEVKNAYDFEGLYQSHFDKGHVDIARFFEMEGGYNIPQMRAAARDALLQLMKKEKGLPGAESGLRDFVSDIDFKYISEGGGGRAGDPINLFVKYFGKNAAENLPKNPTKENIDKFTDFIMASKDSRGRGIDDPFFDRETIDFSTLTGIVDDIPFKTGGRVGFKWGSGLSKTLLRRINKKVIKDAVDDIFPSGDYKYDAQMAAEALVENNPKLFGGKLLDDLTDHAQTDVYGLVLGEVQTRFGLQVRKNMGIKSLIKGVDEQFGEGTLKRASDLPKGTKYGELEAIKDFEARNRTFKLNIDKFMQQFGVSREEATRISLLPAEEQKIAIQRYIDQDFAQQNQLFDYSPKKFDAASGGLAKILEV